MSNEFINIDSANANSSPEHFQLRYISISKYEGDWQSLPHTHHFSELFYVLRGEGAFYIENEKVPVKTDDLVIINPYVEHTEKTLPNDPMEYIVFGVEGLAFSFSGAGQDNPKGYSFYSYGSDKKQFINFAQLMGKAALGTAVGGLILMHEDGLTLSQSVSYYWDGQNKAGKAATVAVGALAGWYGAMQAIQIYNTVKSIFIELKNAYAQTKANIAASQQQDAGITDPIVAAAA